MLCQLSYRGSRPQTLATRARFAKSGSDARVAHLGLGLGQRQVGDGRRPRGRRGRGRRRRRASTRPARRPGCGGRSRSARDRPRTGTRRCSTMLAVTRSRSSWSSSAGSSIAKVYDGRGSPYCPDPGDPEPSRVLSQRRPRPAPTAAVDGRGSDEDQRRGGCRAARCRRSPRRRRAPSRRAAARRAASTSAGTLPPRSKTSLALQGPLAQGCGACCLEGDQLAEHPVVLRGLLDRVGALQA